MEKAYEDRDRNQAERHPGWRDTQDGETPLEARKRQGRIVCYRFQREHGPANTMTLSF